MAEKVLNAIVVQRIEISPNLIKLRIVPDGWELPEFKPGQYGTLGVPGTYPRIETATEEESPPKDLDKFVMRAYSIASSSKKREFLEFYIGLVHSGSLSPRILKLKVGDRLFLGPKFKGMFTLSQVPEDFNAVLIATGTGVAPYMSMIRTEVAQKLNRKLAVFHGAYHTVDLGYHSELSTLADMSDDFIYIPTLSHAKEEVMPWHGEEGFVQKLWEDGHLEKEWGIKPSHENTHVFLCGNPFMIKDMTALLESEGFVRHTKKEHGQFHIEQYYVKLD